MALLAGCLLSPFFSDIVHMIISHSHISLLLILQCFPYVTLFSQSDIFGGSPLPSVAGSEEEWKEYSPWQQIDLDWNFCSIHTQKAVPWSDNLCFSSFKMAMVDLHFNLVQKITWKVYAKQVPHTSISTKICSFPPPLDF